MTTSETKAPGIREREEGYKALLDTDRKFRDKLIEAATHLKGETDADA